VVVVRNGRAVKINVTTGIENNNKIEVSGDLQPDEKVIATANDEIVDGSKIN